MTVFYYIFRREIPGFIHWIKVISLHAVIVTVWKYQKCENNKRVWRHVMHCMQCLRFEQTWDCWKTKENVISRKFMLLTLNIEFISRVRQFFFFIFSLVLRTRENIKKIMSHSWNKFYIQRQTIDIS